MPDGKRTPWKRYLLIGALAMALGQVALSIFLSSIEPDAPDPANGMERLYSALMSVLGTIGTALGSVFYAKSAPGLSRRSQKDRGKVKQFFVEFIATAGLVFATTFLGWAMLGLITITADSSQPPLERVVAVPILLFVSAVVLAIILIWHLWLRSSDDPLSPKSVVEELRSLRAWKWLARPAKMWDPASTRDVWAMLIAFWGGLFVRSIGAAFLGGYLSENRSGRPIEDILKIALLVGVVAIGGLLVALPDEVLPKREISRARKLLEVSLDNGLIVLGGGFLGALIALFVEQKVPHYGVVVLSIYGGFAFAITGWFNSSLLAFRNWHDPEVARRKREKASREDKEQEPTS